MKVYLVTFDYHTELGLYSSRTVAERAAHNWLGNREWLTNRVRVEEIELDADLFEAKEIAS